VIELAVRPGELTFQGEVLSWIKVPCNSYVLQDFTLTVSYSEGIKALLQGSATVTLHGKL
jgi:hypothetical protein